MIVLSMTQSITRQNKIIGTLCSHVLNLFNINSLSRYWLHMTYTTGFCKVLVSHDLSSKSSIHHVYDVYFIAGNSVVIDNNYSIQCISWQDRVSNDDVLLCRNYKISVGKGARISHTQTNMRTHAHPHFNTHGHICIHVRT